MTAQISASFQGEPVERAAKEEAPTTRVALADLTFYQWAPKDDLTFPQRGAKMFDGLIG